MEWGSWMSLRRVTGSSTVWPPCYSSTTVQYYSAQYRVSASFILNGISTVVRSWWSSFFKYLLVQYCSTVQFCCACAVNKYTRRTTGTRWDTNHGHYKGTHSRAFQGRALKCYEHAPTALLLRSKHIVPKPRIARAPELVWPNNAEAVATYLLDLRYRALQWITRGRIV